MSRTALICILSLALAVAGCGDDEELAQEPQVTETVVETETMLETETATAVETETVAATETGTEEVALAQQCSNPDVGYTVSYPEGWQTNSGEVITECRLFDPNEIQLEEGTEIPFDISVNIDRAEVTMDQATEFERGYEVLEQQETTVAGRNAVTVLREATEDAPMLEPGTRVYSYFVELDEGTLIASTYSVGDMDFERERDILDQMMETLELTS